MLFILPKKAIKKIALILSIHIWIRIKFQVKRKNKENKKNLLLSKRKNKRLLDKKKKMKQMKTKMMKKKVKKKVKVSVVKIKMKKKNWIKREKESNMIRQKCLIKWFLQIRKDNKKNLRKKCFNNSKHNTQISLIWFWMPKTESKRKIFKKPLMFNPGKKWQRK